MEDLLELQPDAKAPSTARRFLLDHLNIWNLADLADEGALVVTELVTNAVLHARTPIEVWLSERAGCVRLEVRDRDRHLPQVSQRPADSLSGRGLTLISALAARWGAEPRGSGKVVWAEFEAPVPG